MDVLDGLSRVRGLSDAELLLGLNGSLGRSRRAVAEVVAHLGEVEERRLHLLGGYGSMFAYCVSRLKMSEDEAYRRLEVARLVRRFPLLFERLAEGAVSLSVAALLRRHLTGENHEALLNAVSGASVQQAREVLAVWFPQPDVLPGFRKLPSRQESAPSTSEPAPPAEAPPDRGPVGALPFAMFGGSAAKNAAPPPRLASSFSVMAGHPCGVPRAVERRPPHPLEPLAPERYKLQLTAGVELKRKLELARDLLRHAVPSGDLPAILERALDVLIEQTMKRRFAVTARPKAAKPSKPSLPPSPESPLPTAADTADAADASAPIAAAAPFAESPRPTEAPTRHVPNHVRRTVVARDGARCTWQGPDGVRCGSRAWLEHDHITPYARGGTHHASNIRLICRAHNRLSAEQTYGRDTIDGSIERRRVRDAANQKGPGH